MLTDEELAQVRPQIGTLRIIVLALAAGVLSFAAVIISLRGQAVFAMQPQPDALSLIALGVAAGHAMLSIVLPLAIIRSVRAKSQETFDSDFRSMDRSNPYEPSTVNPAAISERTTRVMQAAQKVVTAGIVACALLEGAAFLNLVVVQIGAAGLLHFCVGIALVVLMLKEFPTSEDAFRARLERILGE